MKIINCFNLNVLLLLILGQGLTKQVFAQWVGSAMPSFVFKDIEGKEFTSHHLKEDLTTFILYFDPYKHPYNQFKSSIRELLKKYKKMQLVIIFPQNEKEKLKSWVNEYVGGLYVPDLNIIIDDHDEFNFLFNINDYPVLLVYNSEKQLIEVVNEDILINK